MPWIFYDSIVLLFLHIDCKKRNIILSYVYTPVCTHLKKYIISIIFYLVTHMSVWLSIAERAHLRWRDPLKSRWINPHYLNLQLFYKIQIPENKWMIFKVKGVHRCMRSNRQKSIIFKSPKIYELKRALHIHGRKCTCTLKYLCLCIYHIFIYM
jgi:hypothetical protein